MPLWLILLLVPMPIFAAPIDESKVIDLSYAFGPDTIYWPTAESFTLTAVAHGQTPAGYFYAANNICMAEHGGTHMDAPIHFGEGKATAEQVPVTAGIGPAVVVDVREQAATDRDYRLTVADLQAWEAKYGRIPPGAIVIMFSGWGARWGDKLRYLGTDARGDVANLHFPGFSKESADFLVHERDIDAIAVDTASIDHGPSQDFIVHRTINGANKPAFENVANVDRLPASGATIVALPMKIAGGSGGPTRIIAVLP
ncbi:MAG: cyclase family protein [Deltaproteobacteria bacterium]|nr:cyclase family protein [Deltaproteobacteria bacterium]MBI3390738.1 cyclase family protein [Deltaproteobacteria bacterium]